MLCYLIFLFFLHLCCDTNTSSLLFSNYRTFFDANYVFATATDFLKSNVAFKLLIANFISTDELLKEF